jgi:amphi-Trp domain-containing protein
MTERASLRERSAVTESSDEVRLPRHAAAEQLVDLAYGLTTGEVELKSEGERVGVAVADEVTLTRRHVSDVDRVEIQLTLSWPASRSSGSER